MPEIFGDWDPVSDEFRADPLAVLGDLRARCPVAHARTGYRDGPFWALTRHQDIVAATLDVDRFRNGGPNRFGSPRPPLEMDPPEHAIFRRVLQPYFSAHRMRALEPRVRAICAELLEPLLAAGGGDAAQDFARPLPARVLLAFLDQPESDWSSLKSWSEAAFLQFSHDPADQAAFRPANDALYEYGRALVAGRRSAPRDATGDVVTGLLQAEREGLPITDDHILGVVRLLLAAGHDSTTTAIGICLHRLAVDLDLQDRLRAEPAAIPDAVEELLRYETPVLAMPRTAACDFEFRGRQLRAGDRILLYFASGNRDGAVFEDADDLHIGRTPNRQLSFGHGIHKCIGAPTARLELRVVLQSWLSATRRFELTGSPRFEPWHHFGLRTLPLRIEGQP